MSDTTNSQAQTSATGQMNNFVGNLESQLYSGKDAVANAVMDVYGATTSVRKRDGFIFF